MNKTELQGIAAHILAKETRLVCMWPTGMGKSGVALQFLKANPGMDCLILVPEENNIKNWRFEFKKFHIPDDKVTIMCYASLHKAANTVWDLVVLDEVPHIDTERRKDFLTSVKGQYILALGAVIDEEEMESLEWVYGKFYVSDYTLEQAIAYGYLSPPIVNIFHMKLDNEKREFYHRGQKLTMHEKYQKLQEAVESAKKAYEKKPDEFHHKKMKQAGLKRKQFLGQCKEEATRRICYELQKNNRRFLCFCASINQANRLGGQNAFTSKSPKHMQHLDKFNNHEIDSLFVVGKCIEGQNLVDIECGVIGQLSGTERITVQEVGRILRAEKPKIYIPVFDDTKDDGFLYNITSNIPANYIKHYKF